MTSDSIANYTYPEFATQNGFFHNSASMQVEEKGFIPGIAGERVPYVCQNDSFVTVSLLLSLFLVLHVVVRSRKTLLIQGQYLFMAQNRSQRVILNNESNIKYHIVINCLLNFLYGFLFFFLTKDYLLQHFYSIVPYKIILLNTFICIGIFVGKKVMYNIVNWTFFEKQQIATWNQTYNFLILLQVILLLSASFLTVYNKIPATITLYTCIFILIAFQLLTIMKAKFIFFNYKFGVVHLILYFCMLELMPLSLLGYLLISIHGITIIY